MAQFIRTSIQDDTLATYDENFFSSTQQRCQVSAPIGVIEILWHPDTHRVCIQKPNNEIFFLTSPDIDNLTLRNVFEALGYAHDIITIDWIDEENVNIQNVLDDTVENIPLSQMSIYMVRRD